MLLLCVDNSLIEKSEKKKKPIRKTEKVKTSESNLSKENISQNIY